MASTNHLEKVWIVHASTSEWPQCNCPLVARGIVCKHLMKVFKMLHLNIGDGSIVRKIGTLHGVARGVVVPEQTS